jgi:hypothetical protein
MIGSRYLIRHDAIVVPDFNLFMRSTGVGLGLFEMLERACRDEVGHSARLVKSADTLLSRPESELPWRILLLVSAHERAAFYRVCIHWLEANQLVAHSKLGRGFRQDSTQDGGSYDSLINELVEKDSAGFLARVVFELDGYLSDWDELVGWEEAGEPGGRMYTPPLMSPSSDGVFNLSYYRDAIGYAVSGFLRPARAGLIDGAALEPCLKRLEAIDERYRRVLGDRRDVRTPQHLDSFDFYPAEFWWHHPVK